MKGLKQKVKNVIYRCEENMIFDPKTDRYLENGDDFLNLTYIGDDNKYHKIVSGKIHIIDENTIKLEDHHGSEITVNAKRIVSWSTAHKCWD